MCFQVSTESKSYVRSCAYFPHWQILVLDTQSKEVAMLQNLEHPTVEEASTNLLPFILIPENWVAVEEPEGGFGTRLIEYCRHVDKLHVRASVDLTSELDVYLHVAFRAPGLTPMRAAEHLETFLSSRFPLVPNTEWQVEVDPRRWIHFRRRYTAEVLRA
jgi:hypothetical protein